jgi:hypothetical protein
MPQPEQKQAVPGESPTPQKAVPEVSPPSEDLISEETKLEAQEQAVPQESPTFEPQEMPVDEVPEENRVRELMRRMDKMQEEFGLVKNQILSSQPQQQFQQPQAQMPQQPTAQHQKLIGDIVTQEMKDKIAKGELDGNDGFALLQYQGNRTQELLQQSFTKQNRLETERNASHARAMQKAKQMGYDLTKQGDLLGGMTMQEINRRAATIGMTANEYVKEFPFAIEDSMNSVSANLSPAIQPVPKTQIRQSGVPQSDIPTAVRRVERKPAPSELDVAMSQRYGSNLETVQALQKNTLNKETFETYIPMDLD